MGQSQGALPVRAFVCNVMLLASLALMPACEDDPAQPAGDPGTQGRLPLTTREAVLNNIEYAYDNRNTSAFDELLDPNFTFFFSDGDVGGGLPVQWPRTDELGATNDLFVSNTEPVPIGPECKAIFIDLALENLQWDEVTPEGYPGEVGYTALINYDFTFKMAPDDTYNSEPGAKAEFTVRNAGTENDPHWQLVEWRDLGNSRRARSRTAASTQESTWGGIKALYR